MRNFRAPEKLGPLGQVWDSLLRLWQFNGIQEPAFKNQEEGGAFGSVGSGFFILKGELLGRWWVYAWTTGILFIIIKLLGVI